MTAPIGRLDHVGVAVADLGAARRFVTAVLGLPLLRTAVLADLGVATAFFDAGTVAIELVEPLDARGRALRLEGRSARLDHLAFSVADVDDAAARLADRGVRCGGVVRTGDRISRFTDVGTSADLLIQLVAGISSEGMRRG